MDYWGPSQKMLSDTQFINSLMTYDKDNMNPKIVAEIKKDYTENPDFNPEIIAKASKAAEGMCRWIFAMVTYDRVAKIVAPKKAALAEAEEKLNATMVTCPFVLLCPFNAYFLRSRLHSRSRKPSCKKSRMTSMHYNIHWPLRSRKSSILRLRLDCATRR
jgi:hypothetical protein